MFNIVWDIMPDWMHVIKNLMLGHFLKVVKGDRTLKHPHYYAVPDSDATPAEIAAVKRSCSTPPAYSLAHIRMSHPM